MKNWQLIPVLLILGMVGVDFIWNDGNLVYGLDDAYIHMGVAKNCAKTNTWGINQGEFVSATSSFLYPGLLCLIYKVKIFDTLPLIINLISFIGIIYYTKKEYNLNLPKFLLFVFLGFLPFIINSGMEHTLQVFLSIIFITEILKENPNKILLITSSILLPLVRFESLFLIAASILFLGGSKTKRASIIIPAITTILLLFWHYKLSGNILPLSMLSKSPFVITSSLSIIKIIFRFPYFLMTDAFFLSQYIITFANISITKDKLSKKLGVVYLVASALHAQIGTIDVRYFAYLQAIFLLQFYKINLKHSIKKLQPIVVLALLPTLLVSSLYLVRAVGAPHDIYLQQYHLSKFIQQYGFDTVVLNDIGAASYYTNSKIIDLFGLANQEVLDAKKNGEFNSKFVKLLTTNASIAAIYDDWFVGNIPNNFRKIGDLRYNFKMISGKNIIGLYEIKEEELISKINEYNWPKGVSFLETDK